MTTQWAYYFYHGTLRIPGNPLPIYGVTRADGAIPPDDVYNKLMEQEAATRNLPLAFVEIDTFTYVRTWQEGELPPPGVYKPQDYPQGVASEPGNPAQHKNLPIPEPGLEPAPLFTNVPPAVVEDKPIDQPPKE